MKQQAVMGILGSFFALVCLAGCDTVEAPALDNPLDNGESVVIFAPNNLSVASIGPADVSLTWSINSTTAHTYSVERTVNGLPFVPLAEVNFAQYYSDHAISTANYYQYRLRATDGVHYSAYSPMITVRYTPNSVSNNLAFPGVTGSITSLSSSGGSPDAFLSAGTDAGYIYTWGLFSSYTATPINAGTAVLGLQYSPVASDYAWRGADSSVHLSTGQKAKLTKGVTALTYNSFGSIVFAGLSDGSIAILTIPSLGLTTTINAHNASVLSVQANSNGQTFASLSAQGTVSLWNQSTNLIVTSASYPGAKVIRFTVDGTYLAVLDTASAQVFMLNASDLTLAFAFATGIQSPKSMEFAFDGTTCAVVGSNPALKMWTGLGRKTYIGPSHPYAELNAISFNNGFPFFSIGGVGGSGSSATSFYISPGTWHSSAN